MKTTAQVLKESRKKANITVKIVSQYLKDKGYKASEKTIYSWESGNSEPTAEILLDLCNFYGVDDILSAFGYDGYNDDGTIRLTLAEIELIEKYRLLDKIGKEAVDTAIKRETARTEALHKLAEYKNCAETSSNDSQKCRLIAYVGKIAAAGNAIDSFSDLIQGTIEVADTHESQRADYAIGVLGDSMEPTFFDGDIVLVKRTTDIYKGNIGIFQKDNGVYIKEMGSNGLVSHNSKYPVLIYEEGVICLGKVLGKAEVIKKGA